MDDDGRTGSDQKTVATSTANSLRPGTMAPLIPHQYFHPTEQRLYVLSAFAALQACKLYTLFNPLSTISAPPLLVLQALFILGVPLLRIPKLSYGLKSRWALLTLFFALDWFLFGGWRSIPLSSLVPSSLTAALTYYPTLSSTTARVRDVVQPGKHLLGQYTLHITPYSTARLPLIPPSHPLPCLSSNNPVIHVPITFNTTRPDIIEYTLTLPTTNQVLFFNVSADSLEELKPSKRHRYLTGITDLDGSIEEEEDSTEVDDLLEIDDDKLSMERLLAVAEHQAPLRSAVVESKKPLGSTTHPNPNAKLLTLLLPIDRPATLRLSRVWSATHVPFRLSRSESEKIQIWECPQASFVPLSVGSTEQGMVRCMGAKGSVDITVHTAGHTALKLGWASLDSEGIREDGWLEGIGDEPVDPAFLSPQTHLVPLPITFPKTGLKTYTLTTLSSPHTKPLTLPAREGPTSLTFTVLPSPSISFSTACSPSNPLKLLQAEFAPKTYSPPKLSLLAAQAPSAGNPFVARVRYTPLQSASGQGWAKDVEMRGREVKVEVAQEGFYTLEGVKGGQCLGDVREPSECRVEVVPVPEVALGLERLKDECAGEQGFKASFAFRGAPPFRLTYTRSFHSALSSHPHKPETRTETFHSLQAVKLFQPDTEGTYTYRWLSLSDANYPHGIALDGQRSLESVEQVVHPLAQARIVGRDKWVVWECQGGEVEIDLELKGKAPFTVTVLTASPKSLDTRTLTNLSKTTEKMTIKIPEDRLETGGSFTVSLGEVTDGNGCTRGLGGKGVEIEVRRGKPSAKIYSKTGERTTVVPIGQDVMIPLRLTGEGPWNVKYLNSNHPKPLSIHFRSPNSEIKVNQAGTYRLLEVSDAHCPGTIQEGEDVFTVDHLPRPTLSLSSDAGQFSTRRGVYERPGVCVGEEDQVALKMHGQAPFQITYTTLHHPFNSKDHVRSTPKTHTLGSVQSSAILHLETGTPGTYTYSFLKIGDTHYAPIPSGVDRPKHTTKLTLEQEVYGRPTAAFESSGTISLCSHAVLHPSVIPSNRGRVLLRGKAPFELDLSIRTIKASQPILRKITHIQTNEWVLDVPDFEFEHLGSYTITIDRLWDSSGCEQDMINPETATIHVEVAETASIIPMGKSKDVCVGQTLDFLLQGSAPWKLTYDWNGLLKDRTHKQAKLSLLGDLPGTFAIVSIAHEKNPCQVEVHDIVRTVHPLPSAKISAGDNFIETIEEGEQAEIVFSFEGEPPFAFTYTRSEKAHGRPKHVLETHTVANIDQHTYSIYASSEGTWEVTMVEDKWCRYPPLKSTSPPTSDQPIKLGLIDPFPPIVPPV